jgi:hypothetical protein
MVKDDKDKVKELSDNVMDKKQIVTAMKLKGYEELNSENKETARNIICKKEDTLWYAIKKIRESYYVFKNLKIIKLNFADIETTYNEIIYFKDSNKTNLIAQLVEVPAAAVPAISSASPITNIVERTKIDEILKKKELSQEEKEHRVIDYFRAINWYSDMFLGKILQLKPAEEEISAKLPDMTKKNNSFSELELNKWYYKWDAAPSLDEIKKFITTKINTIAPSAIASAIATATATATATPAAPSTTTAATTTTSATTTASPAAPSTTTAATATATPAAPSATTSSAPSKPISLSALDFVPIKEKLLNFYFDYKQKEYVMPE